MAFMIPVVRKEWKVYDDGSRSRESKSCPRTRQNSESNSLSVSPSPFNSGPIRNRSLALEIPNAGRVKPRHSVGSLPSSFHSGHLSPSYGSSPKKNYVKLSLSSRLLKSRLNKSVPISEPTSPGKIAAFSPRSEDDSPPKSGSQNSLQKFHNRLVDRLRRSLRRSSSVENHETVTKNNGDSPPA